MALVGLAGCQPESSVSAGPYNSFGPWTITTKTFKEGQEPFLTNGLIGLRFNRLGMPVRAFLADGYQEGGEEKIIEYRIRSGKPNPTDHEIAESQITQDFHRGTLVFEGAQNGVRFRNMVWLHPNTAEFEHIKENAERQAYEIRPEPHGEASLVPVNRDGQYPSEVWSRFWDTDIEIDGPASDQLMIRSSLFHLRSAVHPTSKRAIAPFGLSSSIYFGHVFWDADLWVFPALMLLDPERAKTIPSYRLSRLDSARQNYLKWVQAKRPVSDSNFIGGSPTVDGAAKFPWESSETGLETVPGPSKYQHHISPTVAFSVWSASRLGLVPREEANSLGIAVSKFLIDRTEIRGGVRHFLNTMSPDEHHSGDDDLYTNLVSEWCLNTFPVPQLDKGVRRFFRPRSPSKLLLNYSGDPMRSYKQAAGVLAAFPLQDAEAEAQAADMLKAYASKVIKNGPAMSDSLHGLIAARAGDSEAAYDFWHRGWESFTQTPHLQFCEKRNMKHSIFYTGIGGTLQTVLYGFAGIRLDDQEQPEALLTKRLAPDLVVSVKPCLPASWKSLEIRGLILLGKRYDLQITRDGSGQHTVRLSDHRRSPIN